MSRSCLWDKWVDSHSETAPTHRWVWAYSSQLWIPVWIVLAKAGRETPSFCTEKVLKNLSHYRELIVQSDVLLMCSVLVCVCSMFYACLWSQYLSKTEGSLHCFVLIYAIPKAKARTLLGSQEHWEKCIGLPYGSDYVIIRFYIAWVNMAWFKVMFDIAMCYSGYVAFPLIWGVMQFTCTDRSMSHALIQWARYLQFMVWGSGIHCLTRRINSHSQW